MPSGCPRGAARPAAPRRGGAGILSPSGSHDRPPPPAAPDEPPGRSAAGSTGSCPRGGGPGGAPRQLYRRPPQRPPPACRRLHPRSPAAPRPPVGLHRPGAARPHPGAGAYPRGAACLRGLDARIGAISSSPPFVVLLLVFRSTSFVLRSTSFAAAAFPLRTLGGRLVGASRPIVVAAKESRAGVGRASVGDDGGGGSSGCSRPADVRVAHRPPTTVTPGEGVRDRAGRPLFCPARGGRAHDTPPADGPEPEERRERRRGARAARGRAT
jgi:hypothetical protein